MKNIVKQNFLVVALFALVVGQIAFVSCSDDPGASNYYTSNSKYAADFLMANEKYSDFVTILQRAKGTRPDGSSKNMRLIDLLSTYGSYTVFAPTNDAVKQYLLSIGKTSLSQLSDADCDTIAFNHIIEQEYFTTSFSNGTYAKANMLDRYLTITSDSDTLSVPGEVRLELNINKSARIEVADDSVENGVVHTLSSVIGASNDYLCDVIRKDSLCQLFYWALHETGLDVAIGSEHYYDVKYSVGADSIEYNDDKRCIHTAVEYDNVAYPETRYFKFTAFVETDEVFHKNNVFTTADLENKAIEIYKPIYPEDEGVTDKKDPRNYLHRFMAYHLLDRVGTYYTLTCVDGYENNDPRKGLVSLFDRNRQDICDYYETMMPYSLMKFSFPSRTAKDGNGGGLYINRRGVQTRPDSRGGFVEGVRIATPDESKAMNPNNIQTAINGVYHYIDGIIAYDQTTQNIFLNERLRMDGTTLSPDFMTSGARGHACKGGAFYGTSGKHTATAADNPNWCVGFKAGFAKNVEYTDATHLHVRVRTLPYNSYQGDEIIVKGRFDVKFKLPPVPAGTWELRFATCVGFTSRGIIQLYIDDVPCGIPFDMRPAGGSEYIGWKDDTALGDEDAQDVFDKSFHNLGWMKGPDSYRRAADDNANSYNATFRQIGDFVRRVVGTFESDGKTDHYLRIQQKMESSDNEMNFDFIELCPSSIYGDPDVREDKH